MLAISTNWNVSRHHDGERLVSELLGLGFGMIELGHGLTVSQLHGVRGAFSRGGFGIVSVHNFCPMPLEIPVDDPDCYEFTSHRPAERERALKLTRETMKTAAEFGAQYVVLHLGRILSLRGMTDGLLSRLRLNGSTGKAYCRSKLRAVMKREKASGFYLKRVIASLEPLIEEAAKRNITLVVENRSAFEALPTERELLGLLRHFDTPHFRYWHDFGHAQMRESMGLLDHAQWLSEVAPYAAGAHLQDARWPDEDHLVPFHGEIRFDRLVPILPSSIPHVLELSRNAAPEAIRTAVARWKSLFPE